MERDISEFLKLIRKAEKKGIYGDAKSEIRLAVVGTDSVQYIVKALRYLLFEKYGIRAITFEGDYDGIAKTLFDDSSGYYEFLPDVTLLLPASNNLDIGFYEKIWGKAPGHVFQSNFVVPDVSALGNLDVNVTTSGRFLAMEANLELTRRKPDNVTLLDFDGLAARIGKGLWFDYAAWFSTKQGFCLNYLEDACSLAARQIGALYGKENKCLVLDLDNTLWGGVVGDDGWDGVRLDPNDPVGEAYRHFQKYVLSLKERGVILAVCSKNDMDAAKGPFLKNPGMVLKLSDIACFVANWEDKSRNICSIAEQLNIGTDSIVFFDDSKAERGLVRTRLPQVDVVDVPDDPAYYAKALSDSGLFDWIRVTEEDLFRAGTYMSARERESLLGAHADDYEGYLAALDMEYEVGFLEERQIPRFTQLINKTNQFNLRTRRYTEAQIREMFASPEHKLVYASLSDRFDRYGMISCVIIRGDFIDTWVMSCRVFKRHVEDKVFEFIKEHTEGKLYGEYIPSAKNAMVKDFYLKMGFKNTDREGEFVHERI